MKNRYSNLFEELYFNGFVLYPIDINNHNIKDTIENIKEISLGNLKDGFFLEEHMGTASDLKPSVKKYSPVFENFYSVSGVNNFLEEYLKYSIKITTLQLRGAYDGSSYLGWHRDTHYYTNEDQVHGNVPPIHKSIFYPKLHDKKARATLEVVKGSHISYSNNKLIDLGLPRTPLKKKVKVYESNNSALIFNTSLLHAVLPVKGSPIYRMIASFDKK